MTNPRHAAACVLWGALLAFAGAGAPAFGSDDAGLPPPVPAGVRLPWARNGEIFQRQWLLLGPCFRAAGTALPGIEPLLHPVAGARVALGSGAPLAWSPRKGWADITDLRYGPGYGVEGPADPGTEEVAYAYATFDVARDGDWELSLGLDGMVEAWVNGTPVAERSQPFAFAPDECRIPVRFREGTNGVLLRFTRTASPWRFVLRLVAPGAVLDPEAEVAPSVVQGGERDSLSVRTHVEDQAWGAPVRVEVLAAGARIVAAADGARGAVVHFPTAGWPDGAYELRCTTRTAWGRPWVTCVPWYKGNALVAARRLDAAASAAGSDTAGQYLRMLAELVHSRLPGSPEAARPEMWLRIHATLLEYEELEQLRTGGTGPVHAGGFLRLAYVDDIDGSTQFCRVYLPPDYDPARRWPLVVFLHGYVDGNPTYVNYGGADLRHNPLADHHGVIVIEPHGRGNSSFRGIGERDVIRSIEETLRRFPIDENRVYLMGASMGGGGTWLIAAHHPELFAAASPVYGGWDNRVVPLKGGEPVPPHAPLFDTMNAEKNSSFTGVESLLNLPLWVHHGDSDPLVNVENSRQIVRMLQRWGYNVRYSEHPGQGHEDLKEEGATVDWMLAFTRNSSPRRVRLRAAELGSAAAYWLRVGRMDEPMRLIVADAEFVRPGVLRLDTDNAAQVSLAIPPALRGSGPVLAVAWNGTWRGVTLKDGRATIDREPGDVAPLHKTPALGGSLTDFIATPFAVVVGTASADPAMRRQCREKGDEFARLWGDWQHQVPRVMEDSAVTDGEEKRYSLLLIGGPDDNRVARRLAGKLPCAIGPRGVTIDGRTWPVSDAALQLIYPSPCGANRYVMVVAGTSAAGLSSWNPGLWFPRILAGSSLWDWTIGLAHPRDPSKDARAGGGWFAAGVFDAHWRGDDRWTSPTLEH